jgi:hypothetical protein
MTTFKALSKLALAVLFASLLFAAPAMAEFGITRFAFSARNQDGTADVQAGSHPYALNTTIVLTDPGPAPATGNLKDTKLELPPGLVGNPDATPRCTYEEFVRQVGGGAEAGECPNETAVGVETFYIQNAATPGNTSASSSAVYNLVPPAGVAAEFGFVGAKHAPVLLEESVRSGKDYGVTTNVSNVTEGINLYATKVTIWGTPGDPAHNDWRGSCIEQRAGGAFSVTEPSGLLEGEDELEGPLRPPGEEQEPEGLPHSVGSCETHAPVKPLLTMPTSCGQPLTATLAVDSWQEPGDFDGAEGKRTKTVSLPELTGCEKLDFSPTIEVKPDGTAGSTPTGLNVNLHVPQEATENAILSGEADVKTTTVTLPAGMQLNPSAADGLEACTANPSDQPGTPGNEIGFTGFQELDSSAEPGVQTPEFTGTLPGSVPAEDAGEKEGLRPGVNFCPNASKIATVRIKTPLLEGELKGSVYLAAPQNFAFAGAAEENPFKSLVAMYLVAEEPERGVLVKLPGYVELGEPGGSNGLQPGQIRTAFKDTPQLPFDELELEFYGTDRAPLATPAQCGTYHPTTTLQPWGGETQNPPSEFSIDSGPVIETASGPQTSSCSNPSPFAPSLVSGTTNNSAGAFSPLTTTLSREDGQQSIQQVTLHYPPGVSGILAGIPLCGEAEANAGTCSSASEIGETLVSVGEGSDPFSVTGGKVYLTGPYHGAPFGLSIVNPAKAGPFDLEEGRPVVVRAKIEVDPSTAALTVTTNSAAEGDAIPHILDGIPLQIKHVNVNITRKGFTFNPTSCNATSITGTVESAEGASSPVSDPFQVTNCQALKFTPKFSVSTSGKTSKADGASLTATLTEPSEPQGSQANIAAVKVDLPKALPSRLKTLQQACLARVFDANPAACPPASFIGHAIVHTPLLPVPLEGPAIFVSHGGEEFPSLTMVLQGYGVTIDLVGATHISPAGITSTTFKTVPDVPFNTFTLTLPQGPYSALGTNLPEKDDGNLCGQTLIMPTAFIAQNGAEIHESTPISVAECSASLSFTSSIKKKTVTLSVYVPAAGLVTASGKGLSSQTKTAKGQELVTFTLTQKRAGKLKTTVRVAFTPSTGNDRKQQARSAKVMFKK